MSLARQPGYPKKQFTKEGLGWQDKYKGSVSEAFSFEFAKGAPLEYSSETRGFVLDSGAAYPDESGRYGIVELNYLYEDSIGAGVDDNRNDPQLDISELEKPLSFHPNYRAKWEYDLAGDSTTTVGSVPPFYEGATDTRGDSSYPQYRWVKDASELPDDTWKIVATRWKPGREGYWVPNQTLTMTKKYSSYKKALLAAALAYKRVTPTITFGLATGTGSTDGEWLQGPTRIYRAGKSWQVDTTYRYSANGRVYTGATYAGRTIEYQGWDHDLYA